MRPGVESGARRNRPRGGGGQIEAGIGDRAVQRDSQRDPASGLVESADRLHQRGPGGGSVRFHCYQGQLPDHHFAFGAHFSAGELELGIEIPGPGADEHVEVAACVLAQSGEVEVPESQAGARIETAACRAYRAQHLEPGAGIDRAPDLEAGGLARMPLTLRR